MGETGFKPLNGLTAAGGEFDVARPLPLPLSSSGFFPSFQKSLFRGFAEVASIADSAVVVREDSAEESFNRGAAESFDSVLGALILSLTDGSFDDMVAASGAGRRCLVWSSRKLKQVRSEAV
jgi:hypothetical protein